ncbi:alpha/beta fold hydrolase [Chelativorans sp. M5D2P16]|uniref:alpha/beta fold hydrolase n=1 Tax=Chelativorans sp. M5D2P16 TaxID=3095678 RepID=UPI002ACAEED4|nr:alpha/beta fold hydrolase [Chelativorans sp. M5D2P16]MDZ5697958.1 alpha/beta fold hydrolase [Chelativorans sp. M5D2P16]
MSTPLYMDETGEGEPTLVLLHGFAATHRAWGGVRAALGSGVHVLAFDLPGHGRSLDFSDAGPARVAAEAVCAVLDGRGIRRFHLAGHSFGGAVAALIALARPQDVASLTLFAPGGLGPEINAPLLRRLAVADSAGEVRDCLALMCGRGGASEAVVSEAMAMRATPRQLTLLTRISKLITREGRQGVLPRDLLAALQMPVHVVWGRLDAVLPVRQTSDLPTRFSRHIFADLGHMLPVEAPEEMARILRRAIG